MIANTVYVWRWWYRPYENQYAVCTAPPYLAISHPEVIPYEDGGPPWTLQPSWPAPVAKIDEASLREIFHLVDSDFQGENTYYEYAMTTELVR